MAKPIAKAAAALGAPPAKTKRKSNPGARAAAELEAREVAQARTDTYTIVGGQSVVWGVADASSLGTVTDVSKDVKAEHELLYSQQGAVNGVVVYDAATVVKMTIVALSTAALPAVGTALVAGVLGTVAGIILSTSDASNYKGLQKFTITVNGWTNFNVAAE